MRLDAADGLQAGDQSRDPLRTAVTGNQKAKVRVNFTGRIRRESNFTTQGKLVVLCLNSCALAVRCGLMDTSLRVAVVLKCIKENRQARLGITPFILYQYQNSRDRAGERAVHTCEQDIMVRNNLITAYLDITSIDCSGARILIKCGKTQPLGELPALT